jgi:hypothetical protein
MYDDEDDMTSTTVEEEEDEEEEDMTYYYWNENDPRGFHPGRYQKLRKLAVLATTVKPHMESRYQDVTGIQCLDDWLELIELHTIKKQQQEQAKAMRQAMKPPPKKKPKAAIPTKPPHPRTLLPGIQLRKHYEHRNVVRFHETMDFFSSVEVIQHQKFLLQFIHCLVQKVQREPQLPHLPSPPPPVPMTDVTVSVPTAVSNVKATTGVTQSS